MLLREGMEIRRKNIARRKKLLLIGIALITFSSAALFGLVMTIETPVELPKGVVYTVHLGRKIPLGSFVGNPVKKDNRTAWLDLNGEKHFTDLPVFFEAIE